MIIPKVGYSAIHPFKSSNNVNISLQKINTQPIRDYVSFGDTLLQDPLELSKKLIQNQYIGFEDKLLDGFKLYDMNAKINKKGLIAYPLFAAPANEVIIVDQSKDPVLKETINLFQEKLCEKNLTDPEIIIHFTIDFVEDTFSQYAETKSAIACKTREFSSNKDGILFGELIKSGAGICRHKALLYKVLADTVLVDHNIKAALLTGLHQGMGHLSGHIYNLSLSNDKTLYLTDVEAGENLDITTLENLPHEDLDYIDLYRFPMDGFSVNEALHSRETVCLCEKLKAINVLPYKQTALSRMG